MDLDSSAAIQVPENRYKSSTPQWMMLQNDLSIHLNTLVNVSFTPRSGISNTRTLIVRQCLNTREAFEMHISKERPKMVYHLITLLSKTNMFRVECSTLSESFCLYLEVTYYFPSLCSYTHERMLSLQAYCFIDHFSTLDTHQNQSSLQWHSKINDKNIKSEQS